MGIKKGSWGVVSFDMTRFAKERETREGARGEMMMRFPKLPTLCVCEQRAMTISFCNVCGGAFVFFCVCRRLKLASRQSGSNPPDSRVQTPESNAREKLEREKETRERREKETRERR